MSQVAQLQTLGKYHLIAELGHGGMADVYLAVAQGPAGFSKLQVVKQLRPSLGDNPEVLTMFLDEARLAARLNHPNVVQTFEVEQLESGCFIAMEYLEGQPLDRILRRAKKKQSWPPLALHMRVLSDALLGLHHAHELCDFNGAPLRVVHRDVSPQNIFVTYDGQVKVVDFGIAKAADGSAETRTGVLKGKVVYMSPEQARGDELDLRSDLFAVGILLFEAVTGEKFWGSATDIQILHRLSGNQIPPADALPPGTPDAVRAICARALAPRPDDRYPSALAFRDDIEAFLRDQEASNRELSAFINKLFADRRAQARAIIDEQLRVLRSQGSSPPLRPILETQTLTLSVPNLPEPFTPPPPPPPPPRSSAAPLIAFGLATAVAGAVALRFLTASPPPTPAASAAPTSAEKAPQTVALSVRASPPQARILLDDAPLPSNPFSGRMPRDEASHRLRVEAPDFSPQSRIISLDSDVSLQIDLRPDPAGQPAAEPSSDKKIDKKIAGPRPGGPLPGGPVAPPPADPDELKAPVKKPPPREIDKGDPWKLPPRRCLVGAPQAALRAGAEGPTTPPGARGVALTEPPAVRECAPPGAPEPPAARHRRGAWGHASRSCQRGADWFLSK